MSVGKEITSTGFWSKYWKSKNKKVDGLEVPEGFLFHDVLSKFISKERKITFLEIGGFPGQWSIFFAKYWQAEVALLDRYIDEKEIGALMKANSVENINIIEGDIFELDVSAQYDVVMSAGFIEHFSDLSGVIGKHVEYLAPNGTLVLTVPNFLGLNGWLQKLFDRQNYEMHSLESMCSDRLAHAVRSHNLEITYINYYGKFGLWLENIEEKPKWIGLLIRFAVRLGRKILKFESRFFSPYLIVIARNHDGS